jgi:parvulin-like peptidyl-prolyl isomerase
MTQRAVPGRRTPARSPEGQREQLVILGAGLAVAAAVLIVAVGVFLTRYRPPRAHVLTVGAERFDAADSERRLRYMLLFDADRAGTDVEAFVDSALDQLEREAIIRARASTLVGDVSAEAVEQELRNELVPPAPGVPLADGATATPTPVSDEAYATALQQRLKESGLSKDELETLARAQLFEKKLTEHFKAALPAQAPQVHLAVARVTDQAKADQIRAIVSRPGVDFVPVASGNSVNAGGPVGDLDWVLVEELDQVVRDAVQALPVGGISPVVKNEEFLEVYKVVEATVDRDLTDEQKDLLAAKRVDEWVEAERANVEIQRDVSDDEEAWIREHALREYARAVGETT